LQPQHDGSAPREIPLNLWAQSDRPPIDLSVGDIRSQIAAERLQITQRSQWRAYRKLPSLFLMVPSLTPYDLHKRLKIVNQFLHTYYTFLYARLQIFIQLSPALTKLCHIKRDCLVHIICSKCPPSAETHAFRLGLGR